MEDNKIRSGSPGEYDRTQADTQTELGEQAPHLPGNVDMGAHGEHHPDLGKYLRRGAVAVAIGAMAYGTTRHIKNKK